MRLHPSSVAASTSEYAVLMGVVIATHECKWGGVRDGQMRYFSFLSSSEELRAVCTLSVLSNSVKHTNINSQVGEARTHTPNPHARRNLDNEAISFYSLMYACLARFPKGLEGRKMLSTAPK